MNAGHGKRAMRARVQRSRDALPAEEARRSSEEIVRRVKNLPAYERARSRLLFASFRSEVATDALLRQTLAIGARLVLPRVTEFEEPLALHEVRDIERDLAPGAFGIREPIPARCPELSVEHVDFILVPGLAFDRAGGRLGYGGGFFDWVLSHRHDLVDGAAAVAVAFALQIVDEVPMQAWDVPVSLIVTEDEIIELNVRR